MPVKAFRLGLPSPRALTCFQVQLLVLLSQGVAAEAIRLGQI